MSLDVVVREKISAIAKVSADLPSVIIVHDLRNMSVAYMSEWGLRILGTSLKQLKEMGPEYFTFYFHPDDSAPDKIFQMILENNTGKVFTMFQQVREKRKNEKHQWCLYLTSMKILLKDKKGKPVLTIASAHPIQPGTSVTEKVKRIIEENSFSLTRKHLFESLSDREKQVLRKIALGQTNETIAKKLFLSIETVKTHRRNLKRKLDIRTTKELQDYAKAFDLV